MQWWCSAQGLAWSWTWRPYPGVWLFIGALAAVYGLVLRSGRATEAAERGRAASGIAGLLTLWVALDWPVGTLGAGYLASVHMVQYLLIALVVPVLLLLGVPRAAWARIAADPRRVRVLRRLTHPLVTLAAFNLVLFATHVPSVVDSLMATQAGSFALDSSWLAAGLLMWWPVVAPVPERPRFPYPLKMGYLFLNTVLNTLPYAFLTFGDLPFYATYELAPRVGAITARGDQQVAGVLMKVAGGAILWTAITILFFRWFGSEERAERREAEGSAA